MNDLISRQAAIDALHMHLMYRMGTDSNKKRLDEWINNLPSAQPECAKDFVMLKVIDLNGRPYYSIIYLENGNEFEGYSSYDLKVISEYLKRYFGFAQPQRQKGEWIDYTEDGYVECPFCHNATNCDGNKDELHFCFSCGADMREDMATDVPTIVQPEIIRCRDCKHYYFADNRIPQEQRYVCDIGGEVWQPDDYCSYAERR